MDESIRFENDIKWEEPIVLEYPEEGISQAKIETAKIETKPEEIIVENPIFSGMSEFKFDSASIGKAAVSYLKRNKIFLIGVFIVWILAGSEDYLLALFNTPVIGRPLARLALFIGSGVTGDFFRYITATYNGPVLRLTVYTFLIAVVAKTVYLLAVTEVVFPAIKEFRSNSEQTKKNYANMWNIAKNTLTESLKNKNMLGFLLVGAGAAIVLSNFLTRNGKFDKSFVLFLLSFIMLKGMQGPLPSALDFFMRKAMEAVTLMIAGLNKNNSTFYIAMRSGAMFGFLIAIVIGNFGEYFGYIAGILILIAGAVFSFINKGSLKYDN